MVNLQAIFHNPKSNYCYPLDKHHMNITLRVSKNDFEEVYLLAGDPHAYRQNEKGEYHWVIKENPHVKMEKKYENELFDFYVSVCDVKYSRLKYAFLLKDKDNCFFYGSHGIMKVTKDFNLYNNFEYFSFPYMNEEDTITSIDWVKKTVWYQIFPERFCNLNNEGNFLKWDSITPVENSYFFGGNIKGIISKLDYIKDIGFNGIYFTPIFSSPSTHKYDTTDYFKIDEQFGTNEDFRQLVNECHKRGIKVMLDAVFNHCGFYHPFFYDVVKNGVNSKYIDCFYFYDRNNPITFDIKDNKPVLKKGEIPSYETFAFTPYMPKIKQSHPIWEKYLLDVCTYWIKEYDIDAWRLDVSNEVSHAFWRKFKKTCLSLKPDFYVLGENWENSNPWLSPDQLNAVMNYELCYPIWNYFSGKIDVTTFKYRINELFINYQKEVTLNMFNLLDSHDTERMITRLNSNLDLYKCAMVFLLTHPGSPSIYYGDEIALEGKGDPDNRRCMKWENLNVAQTEMIDFFKRMIFLRKNIESFSSYDFKFLNYSNNVLLEYMKDETYFVINTSNNKVPLDSIYTTNMYDIYNDKVFNQTEIDSNSFLILRRLTK